MDKENNLNLVNLGLSEECNDFLNKRIDSEQYRGIHYSQHNRYSFHQVVKIFRILYKHIHKDFLEIRTTDLKKRPENFPNERVYSDFCNEINEKVRKVTQDSIRKNLFVDFNRMKLLDRYDKKGRLIEVNTKKQSPIIKVKISELGLELIESHGKKEEYRIYLKAVNFLFRGIVDPLIDIIRDLKGENEEKNYLKIDEFQFFVSFLGNSLDGKFYNSEVITNFLLNYRKLSILQKRKIKSKIKEHCSYLSTKKTFSNKKDKRDFSNWRNEAWQLFYLLDSTPLFEFDKKKEELILKPKLRRSSKEKRKYFEKHKVSRTLSFELHHIIPLFWAAGDEELFKLLDVWENMIYINAGKHSVFTQSKQADLVLLSSQKEEKDNLIISDIEGNNEVILEFEKEILYSPDNKKILFYYNRETLTNIK